MYGYQRFSGRLKRKGLENSKESKFQTRAACFLGLRTGGGVNEVSRWKATMEALGTGWRAWRTRPHDSRTMHYG